MHSERGVSLIEVLIGVLVIVVASIGTLSFFSAGLGGVKKQGNRRAALERARERLEILAAIGLSELPAIDDDIAQDRQPTFWVVCEREQVDEPCEWLHEGAVTRERGVAVDSLTNQEMETTARWIDDPSANTTTPDVLELSAKVWFMPGNDQIDDDFHRVHLRTLRAP